MILFCHCFLGFVNVIDLFDHLSTGTYLRLRWFSQNARSYILHGRGAGTYGSTHFCGVQVAVDEGVDDGGQVVCEHGVALVLQVLGAQQTSHGVTQLLEVGDDLLLGGLVGDEVIDVGHDVDADLAGEVDPVLGEGEGGGQESGEDEGGLHGGGGEAVEVLV